MGRILAVLIIVAGTLAGCARGTPPVVNTPTPLVVQPVPALPTPTGTLPGTPAVAAPTAPAVSSTPPGRFPTAPVPLAAVTGGARYSLWYPAYAGASVPAVLERVRMDETGRRTNTPARQVDVDLNENNLYLDSPLYNLIAAPGGRYLALEIAEQENILPRILGTARGEVLPAFARPGFLFYDWLPDGRRFLGHLGMETDMSFGAAAEIELNGSVRRTFTYPKKDDRLTKINALAAAPSGKWVADSLSYHPYGDRFADPITEIGITDLTWGLAAGTREVLCIIDPSTSAMQYSLKWSPDEQSLLWVSVDVIGEADGQTTYWLWIGNRQTRQCVKTALVRSEPSAVFPGGFVPQWSPDGGQILFIQGQAGAENALAGNVFLLDVQTGRARALTHFEGEVVTFARFLPDPARIAYSIRRGEYGEIWVISLDGSESYAIAGPTSLDAPFAWVPAED